MRKSNIIIFVVIILVVIGIFGYAIWNENNSLKDNNNNKGSIIEQNNVNELIENNSVQNAINQNEVIQNVVTGNTMDTNTTVNTTNYVGDWYISEEAYFNSERIDEIMEMREENRISTEEFENQMKAQSNTNIVELDVDSYFQNKIKFDFKLTSPAPTQREGKLDDIIVDITNGVGTFTYRDNWGTSGNGTITLGEDKIQLKLETTKAAQGALWGVEGTYTFSYKRVD